MVTTEREMVRKFIDDAPLSSRSQEPKFTSLQPTYEDTVPPADDAWEYEY